MTTPFLQQAYAQRPHFTETLAHPNFLRCLKELTELGRMMPQSKLVIVVGPSNVGKSTLLSYLGRFFESEIFRGAAESSVPIIGATAYTPNGGRATPKFLIGKLLEDIGHFLYDPRKNPKAFDRRPMSEARELSALQNALAACATRIILIDEGNNLVRAVSEDFKSRLLESLKCLVSANTTPIIFGGYELADVALSHRAHLAARTIVIHLPPYGTSSSDKIAWSSIVASMSASPALLLNHPDLLQERSEELLEVCHGVVGILESILITAMAKARALDQTVTDEILTSSFPRESAWCTMENDVEAGKRLLDDRKVANSSASRRPTKSASKKNNSARAFERKPRRSHTRVDVRSDGARSNE